ncbi:MAG: hypothetical protein K6E93_05335 [Bacteroidales bacterium]|nr:hypothetical protein [Bacteroidales bacterium]
MDENIFLLTVGKRFAAALIVVTMNKWCFFVAEVLQKQSGESTAMLILRLSGIDWN